MTEHLTITNTDRRKKILLLQALAEHLKYCGDIKANNAITAEARKGFKLYDEAHAILWALNDYVQRHINLETGEIRAVNPEPAAVE